MRTERYEQQIINGEIVNVLVEVVDDGMPEVTPPNWKGLKQAFWDNLPLFGKAMTLANPNAFSVMLKVLTDGENTYAAQNAFLIAFNLMGVTFTQGEKDTINQYLTDNGFTIQV